MPSSPNRFQPSLFLCAVLTATASAAQGDKPVTPVPVAKELLDGPRLILKAAQCSLALPGTGWAWMTYEGAGKNFLCVNSHTNEIYLVGIGELKSEMSDHQPQSLIANARKSDESRGGKLEHDKYEYIDIPGAKKSVRITFSETDKSGQKQAYIYLVNTVDKVLLKMHCNGTWATEPEGFSKMVKSLKMNGGETKAEK